MAFDDYECIFLCQRNPSCWSVNLAVARKRDAKIWCELLSSHKHRLPEEFRENRTSHLVSIMVGLVLLFKLTSKTLTIIIQSSLISMKLNSSSRNISGRKGEVPRLYSINKCGL